MNPQPPLEDNLVLPPADLRPLSRICPQCGQERIVTEFEGLPADTRCNRCVPNTQLPLIRERKLEIAANAFQKIIAKTRGGNYSIPPLNQFISGMIGAFGGVESFINTYKVIFDKLQERSPASALNHMATLVKLWRDAAKIQQVDDIESMNADQTRREMQLGLFEILAKHTVDQAQRDLLMQVLESSGLTEEDAPDVLEHA